MSKEVVLLINTGTPSEDTPKEVGKYLKEFLMDEKVVSLPFLMRWIVMKKIVAPIRSHRSAKKYQLIFENGVSPLLKHTSNLTKKLKKELSQPVYFAMRYGKPRCEDVINNIFLDNSDLETVLLVPMYPHYSQSSFETAYLHCKSIINSRNTKIDTKVIKPYFSDTRYINSISNKVAKVMENKSIDKLVFSFHGIPVSHLSSLHNGKDFYLKKGDCCNDESCKCYLHQCFDTVKKIVKTIGLEDDRWEVSFQSRFGNNRWLQPYTIDRLMNLPKEGCKNIAIIASSFLADCLETLEELNIEGKAAFLSVGGDKFEYISALNDDDEWVETFAQIISKNLSE